MTIRLRCAECRRKLKVPDAARGKKVQCPVCGALFREGSSPPVETPLASSPIEPLAAIEPEAVEAPASSEPDLIEAAFAEMMASAPDAPEQAASSSFPNLELEAPPAETEEAGFEPLGAETGTEEPAVVDEAVEEEPVVVEEAVEEEPVVVDEAIEEEIAEITEAVEEEIAEIPEEAETVDAVDAVDDEEGEEILEGLDGLDALDELDENAEAVEEAEPEDEEEKRPKKKKKGGFLSFLRRKSSK